MTTKANNKKRDLYIWQKSFQIEIVHFSEFKNVYSNVRQIKALQLLYRHEFTLKVNL